MKQYTDGYFLCVPCAGGCYSFYPEFFHPETAKRVYILRGGHSLCTDPLLSRIAEEAQLRHIQIEKIYSQRRPAMLEALAMPEKRVYLIDGNDPRTIHIKYPIAVETIVNTDLVFDHDNLKRNADAIRLLEKLTAAEQRRSMNYLSAVRSVSEDSFHLLSGGLNQDKIRRYAARFAAREFPSGKGKKSRAKNRFLSAVTREGIWTNIQTLHTCKRVIAIDDSVGLAASALIYAIKQEAEERGLDCTVCRCQTHPAKKAEHILIPEANIAFFTANRYHPAPENTERTIHMTRFLDREQTANCRFRLNFNKKAIRELLEQTIKAEAEARELLDLTDAYYEAALNEEKLSELLFHLRREVFTDC